MHRYLPSIVLSAVFFMTMLTHGVQTEFLTAQIPQARNTDGFLFVHMPLDGNPVDVQGGLSTAITVGNPQVEQNCIIDSCYRFDGRDDHINLRRAPQSIGIRDTSFTFMAWVNPDVVPGFDPFFASDKTILGTDAQATDQGLHFVLRDNRAYMGFFANDTHGRELLQQGNWYHMTFQYDKPSTTQRIYINGERDIGQGQRRPFMGLDTVFLGRSRGGHYFEGLIDDVRIYNTTLTGKEISDIYEQTRAHDPFDTDSTLVLHYPLDTTNVLDLGPNNFLGLSANGPVQEANCLFDSCLRFDGFDDHIITPDLTSQFSNPSITASIWFNTTRGGIILDEIGQTFINSGWHNSHLEILNDGEVRARVWNFPPIALGTASFGEWHHAVVRYDHIKELVTGFLDGNQAPIDRIGVRQAPFQFGSQQRFAPAATDSTNMGDGRYFQGLLDDFRVFNDALPDREIRKLYEARFPVVPPAPPSPPPTTPPLTGVPDFTEINGKTYVRVLANETGDEACARIGQSESKTGSCIDTSLSFDQQNSGGVCQAFFTNAQVFNTSQELASSSEFGSNGYSYCHQTDSISCDQNGGLRDENSPETLTNTCHICPDCEPIDCTTTPKSRGYTEHFVECSLIIPEVCADNPVTTGVILDRTLIERFNGSVLNNNVNNPPGTLNLIDLIADQLGSDPRPNEIIITGFSAVQGNAFDLVFTGVNTQTTVTVPNNTLSANIPPGGIRAFQVFVPPNNGFSFDFIREKRTELQEQISIDTSNSDGLKDIGALDDLISIPAGQSISNANVFLDEVTVTTSSGNIIVGISPLGFSSTPPNGDTTATNLNNHLFVCKDFDQNASCDVDECSVAPPPDPIQTPEPIAVPITINKSSQPVLQARPLLQANELLQFTTNCDTCAIQLSASPNDFVGGSPAAEQGFSILATLIETLDGSLSHHIFIIGEHEEQTELFNTDGVSYFSDLPPSVLHQVVNDYAFRVSQTDGSTQLIPANTQVLGPHLSQPLQNSQLYPHLFLGQDSDQTFHSLLKESRYWDLDTLASPDHSPAPVLDYFTQVGNSPTASQCQQAIATLPDTENFLNSPNTFQFVLDFLTLCARL